MLGALIGSARTRCSPLIGGYGKAAAACVVEDEPARFARAVTRLFRHPRVRSKLEAAAAEFAHALATWDEAAAVPTGCYRELLDSDVVDARVGPGISRRPKLGVRKILRPGDRLPQ